MITPVRSAFTVLAFAASVTAAQAGSFDRVTTAGTPVRIASHATWNDACVGRPALVEVVVPPAHGKLVGVQQPTTITRIETGLGTCRGHRVEAEAVIYKPAPGFRGMDQFAYTSTTSNGTVLSHQGAVEIR